MRKAIYPGSFDPVTFGHIDIIKRGSKIFEKVIVAVLINIEKKSLFTIDERVEMLKEVTCDIENVEIISFEGLLVDLMQDLDNPVILKGLRNSEDFNYEMKMDILNNMLYEEAETVYISSKAEYSAISSSAVKQIVKFGGSVEKLVPKTIEKQVLNKLKVI